jgi:UTP--glucose-1-phosphate uridylyltransferase|tara:strand:+ start:5178 stop:6032 length:855 start_codon:yes stop_codon:yes gene_type:complete
MKAIIPAAGFGTRFLPITKAQPKEMLPVYDKPTIQYVVEEAVASGIEDILIITGRGKRAIEDHFDRSIELELALNKSGKSDYLKELEEISNMGRIHYIRQKKQYGLGDAILCGERFVGDEPFAVLLGDTITFNEIPCTRKLIDIYDNYNRSIISVEKVENDKIPSYGIIKGTLEGEVYRIEDLVEKPTIENAPSNLGIIGRYILSPKIFKCIKQVNPGVGGEIQLTDALRILNADQQIYAYEFKGKRYDIGTKFDWLKCSIEIALLNKDIGPDLRNYLDYLLNN